MIFNIVIYSPIFEIKIEFDNERMNHDINLKIPKNLLGIFILKYFVINYFYLKRTKHYLRHHFK